MDNPAKAVIVAASVENGIEHYMTFHRSVNKAKFRLFLDEMKETAPPGLVTIVMDNLKLHSSEAVKSKMLELGY